MARPIRAPSTSHRRAWVSSGGTSPMHVAVVVEAVEAVGQLAHPRGDLVRRAVGAREREHLGQLVELAEQVELALVHEQRQVDRRQVATLDAGLGRLAPDGVDPRVGVLDVEDRVLVRLRGDQVEVDGLPGVERLQQEREPSDVGADRVDEVVEQHEVAGPLREPHLLAALHERDELARG